MHVVPNANSLPTPELQSIRAVCARLSLSRGSIYKLAKRGDLKFVKLNGKTLIPTSSVAALLQRSGAAG